MAAKKQKKKKKPAEDRHILATNRKARHLYKILETHEAGIVLRGSEIKSIRDNGVSIAEAYARIQDREVWLIAMHIAEYFDATFNNHEPTRRRKLLLHRAEIRRLERKVKTSGHTLVPLDLHLNERGIAKVTIALVTGKKEHDRREDIKKRDIEREIRTYKR